MTATMVSEKPESESFSADELYELQRRRGKLKPPAVAYKQRDLLKAKLRGSDNAITLSIRSIGRILSAAWRVITYIPWNYPCDLSWLKKDQCNPASRFDDILSGRSRFERMNRPSAAKWGPLDRNLVYDPYQGAMTRKQK